MVRWRMCLTMMLALLSAGCGNGERHVAPPPQATGSPPQAMRGKPQENLPEVADQPAVNAGGVTLDETPPVPVARPRPVAPAREASVAPPHTSAAPMATPKPNRDGAAEKTALAKGVASRVSPVTGTASAPSPREEPPEAADGGQALKTPTSGAAKGQGKEDELAASTATSPEPAKPAPPAPDATVPPGNAEPVAGDVAAAPLATGTEASPQAQQPAAQAEASADSATAETASATPDQAEPPAPPGKSSFEEDSLDCDVIELMGRAIGRRRLAGEASKPAIDGAIDDVLRQTGGVRDKRFVFSGRVYGMLIYQLKADHSEAGFGAYAHSACMILRGRKGIVPADDVSKSQLDESLAGCEAHSADPEALDGCIATRMEAIVRQRGF